MLTWIREKFGTVLITGIIGFIAFVFVFYGIFSPKATRGLHEGAVAGKVNGDSIEIAEFNRAFHQRVEFFKSMMGGGEMPEEQIEAFHVRQGVFQELARRKLMTQEADHQGLTASDEEIRTRIQEIPSFQKDGHFDFQTYKQVLISNNYTPEGFEKMLREDLSQQVWQTHFRGLVHVSDDEVRKQFMVDNDRRSIKYVLMTTEVGKRGVNIPADEVAKFAADTAKQPVLKARYDAMKGREYKGKSLEEAKPLIARDMLASQKIEDIRKFNDQLADKVLAVMTVDKGSDAKVNALVKAYGAEVKNTGPVDRQNAHLPGIGEARELMADAFSAKSPIVGHAKKYSSALWTLVAVVSESTQPDLSKLDADREKIATQLLARKEREIMDGWIDKLMKKASVDPNPDVVGKPAAGGGEGAG